MFGIIFAVFSLLEIPEHFDWLNKWQEIRVLVELAPANLARIIIAPRSSIVQGPLMECVVSRAQGVRVALYIHAARLLT